MQPDNTVRFDYVAKVLDWYTMLATEMDPQNPDPDLDVHAFRPWRGAVAEFMHNDALTASGFDGLNDTERRVFHFWRLLEGPWVLPDEVMDFPFIGLPDAIITRGERRAGRWVHRRRELRNPDGSPAGEVGAVRPRRPEALAGQRGLMASRAAVSVLWRGPGDPPLLAEGQPWDGETKAWIAYVRAISDLPLQPAVAAQVRLPGARVHLERHRVGERAVAALGLKDAERASFRERWRAAGIELVDPEIESADAPFRPDVNAIEYWVVRDGRRKQHRSLDWGRYLRRDHDSHPPAALWQAATGRSAERVCIVPWRSGLTYDVAAVNAGIRTYVLSVTGLDLGSGHIRALDFRRGFVTMSAHEEGLAAARRAAREAVRPWRTGPGAMAAVRAWLDEFGPTPIDDADQSEPFDGPMSMVSFFGDWKRQTWRESRRQIRQARR